MNNVTAFLAGFVSAFTFQRATVAVLLAATSAASGPLGLIPSGLWHLPGEILLAVWGGVWAVVLSYAINHCRARDTYWAAWLAFGTIPALIDLYIVLPLLGVPLLAIWSPAIVGGAVLLNAVWGLGVALFKRAIEWLSHRAAPGQASDR